ncbi:hypothetical protein PHMEG_00013643 [Phytophthora megakarya]|uniref:Carbohydrate-binding protein n=1 Tax=Phytophthora megakarya TaxID=4795 RepID=A0A225W7B1_9STRA|nr:hypothetical protein PHMEG_00013643 [Phytophthora megakarya]
MSPLRLSLFVALGASHTASIEVSVCRDATYDISVEATSLCVGSGVEPVGWSCPKAGDVAVVDCFSTLPSYGSGRCVAPEDTVCQVVNGDTWGCVLPSVGCNDAPVEKSSCETWDYSGDDSVDLSGSFDGNEGYDESWFTQTTKLREIYDCGDKPTPAPTTVTPAPTECNPTEAPTPTPTEDNGTNIPTYDTAPPSPTDGHGNATPTPSEKYDTEPPYGTSSPTSTEGTGTSPHTPTSTSSIGYGSPHTPTSTSPPSPPLPTGHGGSSSGQVDTETGIEVPPHGETEVGDEDSADGHSTSVTFAATDAVSLGGLSDELVAVIAVAVAFVVVVVAAVAVVYARRRHVKIDVEEGGDEDEGPDEEDEEDTNEDVESETEDAASPVVPPTPSVITRKMTTPTAAVSKAKETTSAATSVATTAAEPSSDTISSDANSVSDDVVVVSKAKSSADSAEYNIVRC